MKIPKAPVAEVCLINLKAPHNLRDPSTFEGAIWATSIATLKKCPGFRDIYTSSFIEDRSKARIFLNWDCKEDHFAFYDTPHFPAFREQLLSLCAIPPIPIHVLFTPAQPQSLLAPVSEVFMAYFALDISEDTKIEWDLHTVKFLARIETRAKGIRGVHGGWVIEEMEVEGLEGMRKAWMGTWGWESMDAQRAFAKTEAFAEITKQVGEGPERTEIYHVELD